MKAALRRVLALGLLGGLVATGLLPAQAKATDFGAWVRAPNLHEGHVAHTATLLKDGRVLIAGGADVHGVATAATELFDPKANRWIRASNRRSHHCVSVLPVFSKLPRNASPLASIRRRVLSISLAH